MAEPAISGTQQHLILSFQLQGRCRAGNFKHPANLQFRKLRFQKEILKKKFKKNKRLTSNNGLLALFKRQNIKPFSGCNKFKIHGDKKYWKYQYRIGPQRKKLAWIYKILSSLWLPHLLKGKPCRLQPCLATIRLNLRQAGASRIIMIFTPVNNVICFNIIAVSRANKHGGSNQSLRNIEHVFAETLKIDGHLRPILSLIFWRHFSTICEAKFQKRRRNTTKKPRKR